MTPFTITAAERKPKVVQALLDAGGNVNGAGEIALFAMVKNFSSKY